MALKYINRVLHIEPNNTQAKALKEKIELKMKRGSETDNCRFLALYFKILTRLQWFL